MANPFAWLQWPGPRLLLDALPPPLRFVGGSVRDSLLGIVPSDFDLATPYPPTQILDHLKAAGILGVPTGLAHGTVMAIIDGKSYEITTLREDVKTDGRHAQVRFTDSWEADAARRDFTMNALSVDGEGNLFDYFQGAQDLLTGRVRFIGDPNARIQEDYLRILRFFRFQAFYGHPPEKNLATDPGWQACLTHRSQLTRISPERITREFLRLLEAPHPGPMLRALEQGHFSHTILGQAFDAERIEALLSLENALKLFPPDPLLRLAALCSGPGPLPLRLSNKQKKQMKCLTENLGIPLPIPESLPTLLYHHSTNQVKNVLSLRAAEAIRRKTSSPADIETLLTQNIQALQTCTPPVFPLRGEDALDLGLQGSEVGQALNAVKTWWTSQNCQPDRTACLKRLRGASQDL